jgi:oxygen-independent coproporphyrinogen-3 oxidase
MKPGIYIHIPFCEQRCYYCAFTVSLAPPEKYESYVRRLIREIELSKFSAVADTVYFGGGTPSLVDPSVLQRIITAVPKGAEEISVEVNPGTLNDEKLEYYRHIGINRISLGAQSFDDDDLHNVGRVHRARHIFDDFESLRRHGFHNINIDLIAGIPAQNRNAWSQNLDRIETLRPEHVSIYMFEFEERSRWAKHRPRIPDLPDDDSLAWFYGEAVARLEDLGYTHYEISNWALPGFECRHNLKYWTWIPYRGFGVSAHSWCNNNRMMNPDSIAEYSRAIDSGRLPIVSEAMTPATRVLESFMLGLRLVQGFDTTAVAKAVGFEYPQEWFHSVHFFEEKGLVEFDANILKLTSAGRLLANSITLELTCPITALLTYDPTR